MESVIKTEDAKLPRISSWTGGLSFTLLTFPLLPQVPSLLSFLFLLSLPQRILARTAIDLTISFSSVSTSNCFPVLIMFDIGGWFFDYDADIIYMNDNPNGYEGE